MKKRLLVVLLSLASIGTTWAEGYQVNAQSAKQSGMGHLGVAMKLGAESMHFNPAALSFMKNRVDLSIGMSGVFSDITYEGNGSQTKSNNKTGTPIYIYSAFRIYDNLSAGISFTTPYGNSVSYDKNWAGAHLIQDISLKVYAFQPTISYRPIEWLSLGAGLVAEFGTVDLSRALMPVGSLVPMLGPDYADVVPVQTTLTGEAAVRMGYNVGAMVDLSSKVTLGMSYRSKIEAKVEDGTAIVEYANEPIKQALVNQIPPLDQGTFKASLPMPSNLTLGVAYQATERLLLSGEVQFIGWGTYDYLSLDFSEEVLNGYSIKAKKNYHNTRAYRVGGEYAITNRFDIRLGAYYDQSPVDDDYLNPETPSMDKLALTTGFTFRPTESVSINASFVMVHGFGRDGSYTDKLAGEFKGHYKADALMPSVGIGYTF